MKRLCLAASALLVLGAPAEALDSRLRAGLLKLDPETRLEQRCDAEVLDRITQDNRSFAADRVVAYAFSTPEMNQDSIKSVGAAFRSKGEWYRLKFKCVTAPDHMEVIKLRYRIGDQIPKDDWSKYDLYP
ncbi:DUF930 domain-containing protein [Mesorhizobium sp. SP-1A]|uniref:DUF930 domain-containing protein n=1 Tax=Mesorhizobium sp. SP-1A TaxID=3077840 RepID=UPI0039657CC8